MSRVGSVDNLSNSGAQVMANLCAAMILAGWSVQSYGTGMAGTYSASGAGWTSASLVSGLDRSWVRLRDPAGVSEVVFQSNFSSGLTNGWRCKISPLAKFIGGSPNANTAPSALTDEYFWSGAGSDASPTYETMFNIGGATVLRHHCVAENAPINGRYGFCVYGHNQGTNTNPTLIGYDPVLAGTHDPTDLDPAVIFIVAQAVNRIRYWIGLGSGGAVQTNTVSTGQLNFVGTLVLQPGSTNDPTRRYEHGVSTTYEKGFSSFLKLKGISRAYPNVVNPASDMQVYMGGSAAGWVLPGLNNQIPTL